MSPEFCLSELTETLQVSRSGYYAWRKRQAQPGPRARQNAVLLAHIGSIHQEHLQRYGSPRIFQTLRQRGIRCGHNRVARLMKVMACKPHESGRSDHARPKPAQSQRPIC